MGRGEKLQKGNADAKRARAGKSLKDDGARVHDLEKRLKESLEREKATGALLEEKNRALAEAHAQIDEALTQQAATVEILRIISQSSTDIQPVLDAVVGSAARLCQAYDATIYLRGDADRLVLAANDGPIHAGVIGAYTLSLNRGTVGGRTVLEARIIHIPDVQAEAEEFPEAAGNARRLGFHTMLSVPLMREGVAIGAIQLPRTEVRPFTERQVALLQTFADQAVVAIENARLFKEIEEKNRALTTAHAQLSETLERQTATSEILRVIASAPADLQSVLDAIAASAARVCGANDTVIYRIERDDVTRIVAVYGQIPKRRVGEQGRNLVRGSIPGRAMLERRTVHVHDIESPEGDAFPFSRDVQRQLGARFRTALSTPLLREGAALGAILIRRAEVHPFTDRQVEMLETFADQAVIAIENARLFKALAERTQELTRSVEQLTALGEVGRAVSSTLDLETVLTTIVSRAVQLSGLDGGVVFEYDEAAEEFVHRAATETGSALAAARRATRIRKGEGVIGRTAITLSPVQVPDITAPEAFESRMRENLIESGIRAILAVPMVREGRLIGGLVVSRNRAGEFSAETIELLRTFATQSALAIQNARLFHEIEVKGRQLEAASRHKSEFLANMSHELRTPLNAVIGFSEVLIQRMFGELTEKQDEYVRDIYASGQHLLSLINDILDLSKIEAGRMELERTDFDLAAAIDNAVTLVRERAGRRDIGLARAIDDRVGLIRADERKVKQVLLNLLSNAIKFTPDGGRIDVRAAVRDSLVEIAVADTGVGIAPEDQAAVFEEFRQVGTADKKVEGTGLGLALSRKFIELHGGRIWVQSQVGIGSTFTFTIPLRGDPSDQRDTRSSEP